MRSPASVRAQRVGVTDWRAWPSLDALAARRRPRRCRRASTDARSSARLGPRTSTEAPRAGDAASMRASTDLGGLSTASRPRSVEPEHGVRRSLRLVRIAVRGTLSCPPSTVTFEVVLTTRRSTASSAPSSCRRDLRRPPSPRPPPVPVPTRSRPPAPTTRSDPGLRHRRDRRPPSDRRSISTGPAERSRPAPAEVDRRTTSTIESTAWSVADHARGLRVDRWWIAVDPSDAAAPPPAAVAAGRGGAQPSPADHSRAH